MSAVAISKGGTEPDRRALSAGGAATMIGIGIATAHGRHSSSSAVHPDRCGIIAGRLWSRCWYGCHYHGDPCCWTAVLSLILGMGLPTTANYIVVSALGLAPVIVTLGQQKRLIRAPDRRASVRVLLRDHGGIDPAGWALPALPLPPCRVGSDQDGRCSHFFYSLRYRRACLFLFIFNTEFC